MRIEKRSAVSGVVRVMDLPITEEQLRRWENGELIQNVMPNLTPDEREFLMTGITATEWDDMFKADER